MNLSGKMKIVKPHNQLAALRFLFYLFVVHGCNPNCLVDKCATCANPKINMCESCEAGWYLRTWQNTDKAGSYNDCWSSTYWWWGFLAILFLVLFSMSLCYFLFKVGEFKFESEFKIQEKTSKTEARADNNIGPR